MPVVDIVDIKLDIFACKIMECPIFEKQSVGQIK